jgi:tetratricopeptide (TPR) repeat protein
LVLDGQLDQALVRARADAQKDGRQASAAQVWGLMELVAGEASAAAGAFDRVHSGSQDALGLTLRGDAAFALGDTDEAVRRWEAALVVNPDHIGAILGKARHMVLGRSNLGAAAGLVDLILRGRLRQHAAPTEFAQAQILAALLAQTAGKTSEAETHLAGLDRMLLAWDPITTELLALSLAEQGLRLHL